MTGHILVVGSINTDLVVEAPRHPKPGETILGTRFSTFSGGKGANQAVAAARLGAKVKMIGCVGNDAFGRSQLDGLAKEGIDCEYIKTADCPTGVALITVDSAGQNSIVVASGANERVTGALVRESENAFRGAAVVLLQLETPLEAITAAVELGKKHGARVVLNPAPAMALSKELVASVDDLIPNQSELSLIAQEKSSLMAVEALHSTFGAKRIIVTLGGDGALISEAHAEHHTSPTYQVNVVDTTAAGDAFVGAYGTALSEGKSTVDAVEWGLASGALAVTRLGAQNSLPRRAELEQLLKTGKKVSS